MACAPPEVAVYLVMYASFVALGWWPPSRFSMTSDDAQRRAEEQGRAVALAPLPTHAMTVPRLEPHAPSRAPRHPIIRE